MGRPASQPALRRTRVVTGKLNEREGAAWDDLRRALGGGPIVPRETDALRHVLSEACRARGIPWPEDCVPPALAAACESTPPMPTMPPLAEQAPLPGERFVEPLDEAATAPAPIKRGR